MIRGLLAAGALAAAAAARADLVHLNQGGTVAGTILKEDADGIEVRLADGSRVHVPRGQVFKIASGEAAASPENALPRLFEDPLKRFTIGFPKGWVLQTPDRDFGEEEVPFLLVAMASRTKQNEPVVCVSVSSVTKEEFLAGGLALPMIPLIQRMERREKRERLEYSHAKTAVGHVHKVIQHLDGETTVVDYLAFLDNVTIVRVTCFIPRYREEEAKPLFDRIVGSLAMPERELPAQGR